jgi:hypothetical protein
MHRRPLRPAIFSVEEKAKRTGSNSGFKNAPDGTKDGFLTLLDGQREPSTGSTRIATARRSPITRSLINGTL